MHVHLHFDHNHDGLLTRVTRDVGSALSWLTGPAMSQQERLDRSLLEAKRHQHGLGIL